MTEQMQAQPVQYDSVYWKQYAKCHDSIYQLMPYRKLLWDAYQALELESGMKVLDAGCGTGNFELFLTEKNPPPVEIEAIDFSSIIIEHARKKCTNARNVNFKQVASGQKLDYPDGFFNRVLCTNTPCFLSAAERSPRFLFKELLRVLAPGGKIVLVTPKSESFALDVLKNNHLRRMSNVRKSFKKLFLRIQAIKSIKILSSASKRNKIPKHRISKPNDASDLLKARDIRNMLGTNNLRAPRVFLTNAGEVWIACGFKPPYGGKAIKNSEDLGNSEIDIKEKPKQRERVIIRKATHDDISGIQTVELKAWGQDEAATNDQIVSRIEAFPSGNLVAEADGKIVGYASFMLVDYDKFSANGDRSWYQVTDDGYVTTHDLRGKDLFGVDLSVSSNAPPMTSTLLLVEVARCGIQMGVRKGVLGSRLPLFHKYANNGMTIEEYVEAKSSSGSPLDPELRFYIREGLNMIEIIPDYFEDPLSLNYGVIMEMQNPFYNKPWEFMAKAITHLPVDSIKLVERFQ